MAANYVLVCDEVKEKICPISMNEGGKLAEICFIGNKSMFPYICIYVMATYWANGTIRFLDLISDDALDYKDVTDFVLKKYQEEQEYYDNQPTYEVKK
jgi:hypothetical protein